jgi:transcriptional regulator with XRE-family HTH domain
MTNDQAHIANAAGNYLRAARRAAALTQPELAERSGVAVRTISLMETGQRTNVRTRTLTRLAHALGIDDTTLVQAFTTDTLPETYPSSDTARSAPTSALAVPVDADILAATFGAVHRVTETVSAADLDKSALRAATDDLTASAGRLFTAYAIALLENAAAHDATNQPPQPPQHLATLVGMQTASFPDSSSDRGYLDWLLGRTASEPDHQQTTRYSHRWATAMRARTLS